MQWTKEELVQLWANNDKRREFAQNYKQWGVWLAVPELGQTFYRYDLPDGSGKILAMEYRRENHYPLAGESKVQTVALYYLWDGAHFVPNPVSEYTIADRLKNLKAALQKELRSETAS
jgi:hypothetical protein